MVWSVLLLYHGPLVQNIMVVYMIWSVILLCRGSLVQNIMVVYGMECGIAVSCYSCAEHNGCVWYGVCYCCIVVLLYRT